MSDSPRSPKRRRILASINPEESHQVPRKPRASPETAARTGGRSAERTEAWTEARTAERTAERVATSPPARRLRLKGHPASRNRHRDGHERKPGHRDEVDDKAGIHDGTEEARSSHRRHRHHHRRRRHRQAEGDAAEAEVGVDGRPLLGADAAFLESLMDAMADDEGADYWQSVYGQPVHIYGRLETMTDEEYAAHVRRHMWERTPDGLLEEHAHSRRRAEAARATDTRARRLRREVEDSLRRGEARRLRRDAVRLWDRYLTAWTVWDGAAAGMVWPVADGARSGVSEDAVAAFFAAATTAEEDPGAAAEVQAARLKEERVRWHPDKMQQRLGGNVDEALMRDVTAVFQIIDKLWTAGKGKVR